MAKVEQIGQLIQFSSDDERACAGLFKIDYSLNANLTGGMLSRLFIENSNNQAREVDIAAYLRGAKFFTQRAIDTLQNEPNLRTYLSLYHEINLGKGKEINGSHIPLKNIRTNILYALTSEGDLNEILKSLDDNIQDVLTQPTIVVSSAHTDSHFRAGLLLGIHDGHSSFMSLCGVSSAQYVQEYAISERPIDYGATYIASDFNSMVGLVTAVLNRKSEPKED